MKMISRPLSSAARRQIGRLFGAKQKESEAVSSGTTYYFHVTSGKEYPDKSGRMFPSDYDAIAHASVLAAELAQDEDWESFVISVTDGEGRLIARVPVRK